MAGFFDPGMLNALGLVPGGLQNVSLPPQPRTLERYPGEAQNGQRVPLNMRDLLRRQPSKSPTELLQGPSAPSELPPTSVQPAYPGGAQAPTGMLAALGLGPSQLPNQSLNTALGLSAGPASTAVTPGQANPNAPGGAYSGATISQAPWQIPEWLNTAGQIANLPQQALFGVMQPLYRTMFSGAPFDVNTVATQHPWFAQHLPAFVGLDPQTGQPRSDVQFMQRYVADPLALVGTTAIESEVLPRVLWGNRPPAPSNRLPPVDPSLDRMAQLARRFVTAQAVTQQPRQSP